MIKIGGASSWKNHDHGRDYRIMIMEGTIAFTLCYSLWLVIMLHFCHGKNYLGLLNLFNAYLLLIFCD